MRSSKFLIAVFNIQNIVIRVFSWNLTLKCQVISFLRKKKTRRHASLRTIKLVSITVKLVYKDHPRDPKFAAVVDSWPIVVQRYLYFIKTRLKLRLQNGGRCRQVVIIRKWSLAQVRLYFYGESLLLNNIMVLFPSKLR